MFNMCSCCDVTIHNTIKIHRCWTDARNKHERQHWAQMSTHLLDKRCGALPRSLHVDSHLSDTVHIYVTKLPKKTSCSQFSPKKEKDKKKSNQALLNLYRERTWVLTDAKTSEKWSKMSVWHQQKESVCVCVCVYRLPAEPLHRAVVVFHHPGMVQQLSNSHTQLGVHLQDTSRNYSSTWETTNPTIYSGF